MKLCLGFYQSRLLAAVAKKLITVLKQCDGAASADTLPRQAEHQDLKLFGIQFQLATLSNARPVEFALVQPPCRQPNTNPVMNQHFHSVSPLIGKEISTVRLRRTEYRNHSGQRDLGTGAHIHGLSGEPNGVDADHLASSRTKKSTPVRI